MDDVLLTLADKLGVATTEVAEIFAESLKMFAMINVLCYAIIAIVMIITFILVVHSITKSENVSILHIQDWQATACIMIPCLSGFFTGILLLFVSSAVKVMMCPEYYAIKEILRYLPR